MTLPYYKPDNKVRTEIVFIKHSEQLSSVVIQAIILAKHCLLTIDASIIGKDLVVSFTVLASNVPKLTDQSVTPLFISLLSGKATATRDPLLAIVRRTYKFKALKPLIYVLNLTINNKSGKIKH